MGIEFRVIFENVELNKERLNVFLGDVEKIKASPEDPLHGLMRFLRIYCGGYVNWNIDGRTRNALVKKWGEKLKPLSAVHRLKKPVIVEFARGSKWAFEGKCNQLDALLDWLSFFVQEGRIAAVSMEIEVISLEFWEFRKGKYRAYGLAPIEDWKKFNQKRTRIHSRS